MRKRLFHWQGQRFVSLNLEGPAGRPLAEQSQALFARVAAELASLGLALDNNVVRTRILARTPEARAAGSAARTAALLGQSRAAGSSYISPSHFSSAADIGLDLFAMAQPENAAARKVTEHAPVQNYIRHLVWGPMVFLAGMTSERPTLRDQVADILPRARGLLQECGCDWANVAGVSFFLHKDHHPAALLADVRRCAPLPLDHAEIEFVEGFSRPNKLVEIEITARK